MPEGNFVKLLNEFFNPLGRHYSVFGFFEFFIDDDFNRFTLGFIFKDRHRSVDGRSGHQHRDDHIVIVLNHIVQIRKHLLEQSGNFLIPVVNDQFTHEIVFERANVKQRQQPENHDAFAVGLIEDNAPFRQVFHFFIDLIFGQAAGLL